MKLLNAKQIHAWDAYTIANEPITSIDLMERAANACVERILQFFPSVSGYYIFCGKGNNGGDGMAIARLLFLLGKRVSVFELYGEKSGSDDFERNKNRLQTLRQSIVTLHEESDFPKIEENVLIIDALFGSGLNKPLGELAAKLVSFLNKAHSPRIAIDVPSGMYLDDSSIGNCVFKADYSLTFQTLKFCFLLPENASNFGKVEVLDIHLDKHFPETVDTILEIIDKNFVTPLYRPRNPYGNKGTFGHALLIAGNSGKMGAAVMAAAAYLRSGAGLLTCSIPEKESNILPIVLPEAMSVYRDAPINWEKYQAIGIGPGLGTDETNLLLDALQNAKKSLVLDADALNMLAQNSDWLKFVPTGSILSPHPKEFSRLFGSLNNDAERIQKALEISLQYSFVVILKGHNTLVAYQGKGYFNTTGNSGMATGGSGDTLTGILTGLLAQGYSGRDAAILGVYLHGLAGDLALENESEESLLPTDISNYLGRAFKEISRRL